MNLQGTYQATARGFGFFTPEGAVGRESDLFVPPRCDGGAWTGDKVTAQVGADPKDPQRQVAKITAVVERTNRTLVGAVERRGRRLGGMDERYRKRAQRLLYTELSVALGVSTERAESLVEERLRPPRSGNLLQREESVVY